MADTRPKLVSVESPDYEPSKAATHGSGDPDRRLRIALGLLLVMFLAALAAAVTQSREVDLLTVQVESLGAQLDEARAEVSAHERHLDEIRGSVDGLQAQLGALDALVRQDPVPVD